MEFWNQFLTVIGQTFKPDVIAIGLQRGFLFSGCIVGAMAVIQLVSCPAGTWLWYVRKTQERVGGNAGLASAVAILEGQAAAVEDQIALLLRELDIRRGIFTRPPNAPVDAAKALPARVVAPSPFSPAGGPGDGPAVAFVPSPAVPVPKPFVPPIFQARA